jgi:hypothetical protein
MAVYWTYGLRLGQDTEGVGKRKMLSPAGYADLVLTGSRARRGGRNPRPTFATDN